MTDSVNNTEQLAELIDHKSVFMRTLRRAQRKKARLEKSRRHREKKRAQNHVAIAKSR